MTSVGRSEKKKIQLWHSFVIGPAVIKHTHTHTQRFGTPLPHMHARRVSFRFKRAAFYQSLKSKVGLAGAKTAALGINLDVEGCGIVAAPVNAPSRAPLLLPLLLSHNLPLPRFH